MSELKPFQKATVKTVLKAFARKDSTHRFLIADEVGLGKTLVAGEIIRRMAKENGKPFVALYVCSNLSIASQNKENLLKRLSKSQMRIAISPVDRLTLLPEHKMVEESDIQLYTLTPDTSIPMRGGGYSSGRKEERALIHALVRKIWPDFFRGRSSTYFRGNVRSIAWRELVKKKQSFVLDRKNKALREMFRDSMRKELGLTEGMHVVPALDSIETEAEEKGRSKVIAYFRNALAAGALEQLKPNLVIFDEFQRFRDLIEETVDEFASRVIKSLRGDGDENSLKLLLLSATPYRPYTRQWEDEANMSHRSEFFELLRFLYRKNGKANRITKASEEALKVMEAELRKGGNLDADPYSSNRKIFERLMRRVICRTERGAFQYDHSELITSLLPGSLEKADLKVFKHLVESLQKEHKPAAPSYWNSIPLPMQTMGREYRTWYAADDRKDRSVPHLTKNGRDHFSEMPIAHPRLRALLDIVPKEQLKLPWIIPSAPWWPLKGVWNQRRSRDVSKTLIFSRFRAVPQGIASLMSYQLETELLSPDRSISYEDLTKRRSLQPKATNVALLGHFYPSRFLVKNTDPIANGIGSLKAAKETVRRQLRRAIKDMGIRVRASKGKRPTWRLIAMLERQFMGSIDAVDKMLDKWFEIHVSEVSKARDETETHFAKMLELWSRASKNELSEITPAEVDDLAKYALSAPGVVVGRALYRHWPGAMEDRGFTKCIEVSWKGLRNYLSSPLFVKALSGSESRYPEAIRKAALEGNLESVLDEHLWITSKIGSSTDEQLAKELLAAMGVRTSNFFLHHLGNKRRRFSLRCHAVMPFTDPKTDRSSSQAFEEGEKPLRADELRRAFNTPFWPHVLATTSVGQEGLDFHVWCETLLHWDLCGNPVDIEQREGRIRRYGGLAIRRKVAQLLWNNKMRIPPFSSPWEKLEKVAERNYSDKTGLSPWWICEGADIKRLIIDLPASEQTQKLEMLRQQRLLYRLALGQPNQEDLLEVLRDKYGDKKDLNNIGLNLSAFVSKAKLHRKAL